MKTCTKCLETKPFSDFSRHAGRSDGYNNQCRMCRSALRKASRDDQTRQKEAERRKRDKERINERQRTYYWQNRERNLADMRERHRQRDKQQEAEKRRQWYLANREKVFASVKGWAQNNRERRRIISRIGTQTRRAKIQDNGPINFTASDWEEMKLAFDHRCAYCGEHCDELTIDHVVPVSKGGKHCISNIVPACPSCNFQKHTKPAPPMVVIPDWSKAHTRSD